MQDSRRKLVRRNVYISLALQFVTLICGLIVPRLILGAYGSEAYGATASISQFLSYITLLEGGIGGVARAALYKPLADDNTARISSIVHELTRFFRIIGIVFVAYALILACSFKYVSRIEYYDWLSSFLLVLVMSISILGQYFIGISYSALIQADQKVYIVNGLSILTIVLNTLMIVVLVHLGCGLIFVKLVSSCIFVIKPLGLWYYVKKKYRLINTKNDHSNALEQKWAGLGQHIAYYIHSNTDISVLTIFASLKDVSIYSVYHMVTANIQNVVASFNSGMEALLGDMIARNEKKGLIKTFDAYETLISVVSIVLYSTVYILIVPFINVYTLGVKDVNYLQPIFAILITSAALIYCLRIPYQTIITAAGHFKQTMNAAYGEAFINIVFSIILVWKWGLIGVAIGTIVAISFRLIYSVIYLSRTIMNRPVKIFIKRTIVNFVTVLVIVIPGKHIVDSMVIINYVKWITWAFPTVIWALLVTVVVNFVMFRNGLFDAIKLVKK